jgi:hypothetical protein
MIPLIAVASSTLTTTFGEVIAIPAIRRIVSWRSGAMVTATVGGLRVRVRACFLLKGLHYSGGSPFLDRALQKKSYLSRKKVGPHPVTSPRPSVLPLHGY